eukprot:1802820-Pyramimonas_sp.AAC.1
MQSPPFVFALASTLALSPECPSDSAPCLANWLLHKSPPPAYMFLVPRNSHCACRSSARHAGMSE